MVESRPATGGTHVIVRDEGPGIPSEDHASRGMGLALVKKIVELHGGVVTIESSGRGTAVRTFWPHAGD